MLRIGFRAIYLISIALLTALITKTALDAMYHCNIETARPFYMAAAVVGHVMAKHFWRLFG